MPQLTVADYSVPEGVYNAIFIKIEEADTEFGIRYRWSFKIVGTSQDGKEVSGLTGLDPSPKNMCGRFLCALFGGAPKEGVALDPESYIGQSYVITVGLTKTGNSTTVKSFVKPPEETPAPAPQTPVAPPAPAPQMPVAPPAPAESVAPAVAGAELPAPDADLPF